MSVKPTLQESTFTFTQEADCCDGRNCDQMLEVEVHDGGGGKFFRIKTEGFAIDSGADLEAIFADIRKLYGEGWNE